MPGTTDGRELGAEAEEEVAAHDRTSGPSSGSRSAEAGEAAEADDSRPRRSTRDMGTTTERPDDWSNFDIGSVVRLFRTGYESAHRLTLRKLHVRWWHAQSIAMERFLKRVGVSDSVLKLIPEVVDSCPVCRQWVKPGPHNVCSLEMADTFNAQVEADLLFYKRFIIFHMICRCTRWHAAKVIPDVRSRPFIYTHFS